MDQRSFNHFIRLIRGACIHFSLLMFHFIPFCDINKMNFFYLSYIDGESVYNIFILWNYWQRLCFTFRSNEIAYYNVISQIYVYRLLSMRILCRNKLNYIIYMCINGLCSLRSKRVFATSFPLSNHLVSYDFLCGTKIFLSVLWTE